MLSYRHAFHAGNHADVLKHASLALLLSSLLKKDKPCTVFDTHGGGGVYGLDHGGLLRTGEAQRGIGRLLSRADDLPPPEALRPYLDLARAYAAEGRYPGSPEIARAMLRRQDRLFVAELHTTEIEVLRGNMAVPPLRARTDGPPSVTVRHESGFAMLKSCLPPQARRGLILTDPSYETDGDYRDVVAALVAAARKWGTATVALWYPLLRHRRRERDAMLGQLAEGFTQAVRHGGDRRIVTAELTVDTDPTDDAPRLHGSGMMVLNAPYLFDQQLDETLPYLTQALAPGTGSWRVKDWN